MELPKLIEDLANPGAYPFPVQGVEVHHTHISVVFLAGGYAYKIKKPVDLGFLDFSSLEKRRHFCQEEVRLNRRLAPSVYRGVVPVVDTASGIRIEADGDIVDWAVKMERLPPEATLEARLRKEEIGPSQVANLARRVARFLAEAERNAQIASFGKLQAVSRNVRENFEQAQPLIGVTISRPVFDRLRTLSDSAINSLGQLIEERAHRNVPCDTHGDLHLDHVYSFPDRPPPDDLVIIDCIEFNERFRFADPVADMAFFYMDLVFHGRRDLASEFANAYFLASKDEEGRGLLSFYSAYRAAVRGKVEGFEIQEEEVPAGERQEMLTKARAHWLLALGELEMPSQRPCLVLVAGLPGTGKSTLARGLSESGNLTLIRSDLVRKELAGISLKTQMSSEWKQGIYTPTWTERTYGECLNRAEELLFQGKRVLVDATFREDANRRKFLELASRLAVPAVFFLCQADREAVQARLRHRQGDASDADWSAYQNATKEWQEIGVETKPVLRVLPTGGDPKANLLSASQVLRALSLLE
jgi:aminoglycoside phosphotransferase family enzyme/predicted kinase